LKRSNTRLWLLLLAIPVAAVVTAVAVFAAISLQPRPNPSGQGSTDPNERCVPSPCGAPGGFEVDVTSDDTSGGHMVLTVVFHNHTRTQLFEAVSYRHTSPSDFRLKAGGQTLNPLFTTGCPSWPEIQVPRGATSSPQTLCFDVASSQGSVLVWDPDLGFIARPVSIALG
jgi:hypothetical protein